MGKKNGKQRGQKGKPYSDTTNNIMSAEEMERAIHPTKRQNAKQ